MDTSRLLLLVYMVITTSECSETAEPECYDLDTQYYNLSEGEAFNFVHDNLNISVPDEEITWFNNNQTEITADENETVHYHGGSLFFLNLLPEDSGFYSARHKTSSGECTNYKISVNVLKKFVYEPINNSGITKKVTCPSHVRVTCAKLRGKLTWNKDNKTLHGKNEYTLWVENAKKKDEGIYTCVCAWTHNGKKYNTSGHRSLIVPGNLVTYRKLEIISPTNEEQFADEDSRVYDAYVVYQTQSMDKVTEDSLRQFITKTLPSVLEEKPPGAGGGPHAAEQEADGPPHPGGDECDPDPAGGHRASGILSPPRRPAAPDPEERPHEVARGVARSRRLNSHFWKRVRYLMPARPARKHPPSAII
ncbi:hypothetical protein F7725_002436 [Dissostichus mawsoni]|uniref:Ig-like domain-containing protein n=1 Tax=Dissostichus mawsoni TaxID=36200 RepID=A0A7J5Y4K7_DISMA|nr:hypothetical protein F7725_002436 [Dissostichus mawsoni]